MCWAVIYILVWLRQHHGPHYPSIPYIPRIIHWYPHHRQFIGNHLQLRVQLLALRDVGAAWVKCPRSVDQNVTKHLPTDNDINGMPEMIIPVRELCWIVAAGALLYGIHRRQIRFFYPIIGVAALVLLIHLVRELLLLWTGPAEWYWHFTLFCNPSLMLPMIGIYSLVIWTSASQCIFFWTDIIGRRIHGMMTLVALRRLFESEHSSDNNFVRFNADREECETNEMN